MSWKSAKIDGSKPGAAAGAAGDAGVTEAVVASALVVVGEHGVGLGRFLEFVLGRLVAGIPIGMVLKRELAVRALDLRIGGRLADAENFVVVAPAHDAFATLTRAGRSNRSRSL